MFTHITAFDPFVTIFHVKMMFYSPDFLSIASCRIANVRYCNDLLVTEIRVAKFGS